MWCLDTYTNNEHRTSNIEHRTSNIEHRTSNIEHRTSNLEHRTSNFEHRTSNIEHRTSNIEHSGPRDRAEMRNQRQNAKRAVFPYFRCLGGRLFHNSK